MEKRKALISVYHKDGITEFAQNLIDLGFEIIASGGTARHLAKAGLPVTDVAELVGGGPILDHRVVTLSREIHAGLLAKYDEKDKQELADLLIPYLDLVCVDLYPLEQAIKDPASTSADIIEQTDIGGPAMLRSGAKGRRIVICDPDDRLTVVDWLRADHLERENDEFLDMLAAKAEYIVAQYCLLSAEYTSQGHYFGLFGERVTICKGENGYQMPAYLYKLPGAENDPLALYNFKMMTGENPSYNNWCDIDRLLHTVTHIADTFRKNCNMVPWLAVGVKHGNACGAGIDLNSQEEAIKKMISGDPVSLFGGLVMVNFRIDSEFAELILTHGTDGSRHLLDGIIAPEFTAKAIAILRRKKDKCRLVSNKALYRLGKSVIDHMPVIRPVRGGFLNEPGYTYSLNLANKNLVKYGQASAQQEMDMMLADAICRTSNSNTITLVKNGRLIGNGVGQQSRVNGVELAIDLAHKNNHETAGAVLASDSFFPFTDGPEVAARAKISAIIGTSGSINDPAVIEFCTKNDLIVYLVPDAEARGFFNH